LLSRLLSGPYLFYFVFRLAAGSKDTTELLIKSSSRLWGVTKRLGDHTQKGCGLRDVRNLLQIRQYGLSHSRLQVRVSSNKKNCFAGERSGRGSRARKLKQTDHLDAGDCHKNDI